MNMTGLSNLSILRQINQKIAAGYKKKHDV
jgi:hypothetical protein